MEKLYTVSKDKTGRYCGSVHQLLLAKFRLKLKKVGKTTRPFRYNWNQSPYDYTVEVRNRCKGLDLIECLKNYGQRFVTFYRRQWSRPLPRKCTGHSKHPIQTTQEKTLHMDITRWSTPKLDWLYSLQPKMEKLYTVSKNKTRSWLWLRPWTPYYQIQT